MKRVAVLVVATVALLAAAGSASAGLGGGAPMLVLQPATVSPGGTFLATLQNCDVGPVFFNIENAPGSIGEADCGQISPAAEYMDAPTTPGTYTVSAQDATFQIVATATLTVTGQPGPQEPVPPTTAGPQQPPPPGGPAAPMPSTGPEQALPIGLLAGVLVIGGAGLLGMARAQRRRSSTT